MHRRADSLVSLQMPSGGVPRRESILPFGFVSLTGPLISPAPPSTGHSTGASARNRFCLSPKQAGSRRQTLHSVQSAVLQPGLGAEQLPASHEGAVQQVQQEPCSPCLAALTPKLARSSSCLDNKPSLSASCSAYCACEGLELKVKVLPAPGWTNLCVLPLQSTLEGGFQAHASGFMQADETTAGTG